MAKNFYTSVQTMLLLVAMALCSMQLSAQTFTLGGNPQVIRWQGAAFTVTVQNNTGSALDDLTLVADATTGFGVTSPSIFIGTLAPGASTTETFTVVANCDAPQIGGTVTYTLKDVADQTVGAPVTTTPISLEVPAFIFVQPDPFQADYTSSSKTYTRVWSITPSVAGVSLTNIRVVNTCNKADISISKVELVDDMLGTNVIDPTMTGVLDATPWTGYIYNFDAAIFAQIGNGDALFDNGETIYIRETYTILSCATAVSSYTYGYGDGTNFCMSNDPFDTETSVVQPGYLPDITYLKDITYPPSSSVPGTRWVTFSNNADPTTNPKAILYGIKLRVSANDRHLFTRAYLVDALGDPIPGWPDLTITNNTGIMDDNGAYGYPYLGVPDPNAYIVSFDDFNDPSKQAAYEALGFSDANGDGIWNDMLPGAECHVAVEWEFDPWRVLPECGTILMSSDWTSVMIAYKNTCGLYQFYDRGYAAAGSTNQYMGVLEFQTPLSIIMTPENLRAGDEVELRIDERPNPQAAANNGGWTVSSNYEHYIIVTLPEGFDYDDTQEGFMINTLGGACDVADVVKTTDANGRVVVTALNRSYAGNGGQYYIITIFATLGITADAVKDISIEHEWAYPGEAHYRYGCHYELPVNYRLIAPHQNMTLERFDAQRMTFGWTNASKLTRIDLNNISSYPGVDRNVAGPYDNVDMTGTITIGAGFSVNDATDRWLIDLSYDATDNGYEGATAGKEYFIFPDISHAVAVSLNGGTPFYVDVADITTFSIPILDGNNHTMRADLTPLTLTGKPLENLADNDVVTITFKTQTTESLPTLICPVETFAMQTYIDENDTGAPKNKNILAKNFNIVDYKRTNLGTTAGGFSENVVGDNFLVAGNESASGMGMSVFEIFVNEFRPNQYANYLEKTFNTLVDITAVRTHEHIIGETMVITDLTPGTDYTVSSSGGKTTLIVTKQLQTEIVSSEMFTYLYKGAYYCSNNGTTSAKVIYNYYPSSERTDIFEEVGYTDAFAFAGWNPYAFDLTPTTSSVIYPTTNVAAWDITLVNQSLWRYDDDLLPHSWISVTLPPPDMILHSSILLTDGVHTWNYGDFIGYGGNRYWVQLGDLNVYEFQNFTFSCQYTSCQNFTIDLAYGMSRAAYPINPEVGFANSDGPCNYTNMTVSAVPQLYSLNGEVEDPSPNGVYDPLRYTFCEDHEFGATFYNTNVSTLYNPVLEVILGVGVELNELSIVAMQGSNNINIKDITGNGPITTERTVKITLEDGVMLQPWGETGDQLTLTFDLKMRCGYNSGSVVYMNFYAENSCGSIIGQTKNSIPIYIDGVPVQSDYTITNFDVTGAIDLTGPAAMAASAINITGRVTMTSAIQQDDFVTISVPPNMLLTDNNSTCGLNFTFSRVEAGNDLYQALLPTTMQTNDYCDVDVTFAPANPGAWSCDNVTARIYTGALVPAVCEMVACEIEEKHSNEQSKSNIPVTKVDVSFLAGSIVANGAYYDAFHESVTFAGTLTVPELTYLDDLDIDIYTDKSGDLLPVTGNPDFHIFGVTTGGGETEFPFSSSAIVIPAEDMCNLWLVIRKTTTDNQYICEDVATPVPAIAFNLTQTTPYDICPDEVIQVGDANPITDYTYTWMPDTYIVGSNTGTPITVQYPPSLIGDQYLTLQVNRGNCIVATTAIVRISAIATAADIDAADVTVCAGATATLNASTHTISNPTFRWYDSQTEPVPLHEGASYPVSPAMTTTYYVSVFGDETCENPVNTRKEVTVTVNICGTVPDCNTPDWERLDWTIQNNIGATTIKIYPYGDPIGEDLTAAPTARLVLCDDPAWINWINMTAIATINIGRNVTIQSGDPNAIITLYTHSYAEVRHFEVINATFTIADIILDGSDEGSALVIGNDPTPSGGGITAYGSVATLNMNNGAIIQYCYAGGGGGVYATWATLNMNGNAAIQYCQAISAGGVFISSATLNMNDDATIQYCHTISGGGGGGVYTNWGALNMNNNASIQYCKAGNGGGICTSMGIITMTGGAIDNNEAVPGDVFVPGDGLLPSYGGGITAYPNSPLNLLSGSISGNTASVGGGISSHATSVIGSDVYTGSPIKIGTASDGPTISGNTATNGSGGGIYGVPGTNVEMFNGVISGNTASGSGGGVCVFDGYVNVGYYTSSFTMSNGTIGGVNVGDGNSATNGGGIFGSTNIFISGGNILNNTVSNAGGGIYGAEMTISGNTVISGNSALNGGGVYHSGAGGGTFTLTDGFFYGNKALGTAYPNGGGAIYAANYTALTVSPDAKFGVDPANNIFDNTAVRPAPWMASNPDNNPEWSLINALYLAQCPFPVTSGYSQLAGETKGTTYNNLYNNYDINFAEVKITYKANYASPPADVSEYYFYNKAYTILDVPGAWSHPNGATFLGWNTDPDGSGTDYAVSSTSAFTEDITLYAQWSLVRCADSDWERLNWAINSGSASVITIYPDYTVTPAEDLDNGILVLCDEVNFIDWPGTTPINVGRSVTVTSGNLSDIITLYTPGSDNAEVRHFTATDVTFTIENIILDGSDEGSALVSGNDPTPSGGGILVNGLLATLNVNDGAIIQYCHANQGGGIYATWATLNMNDNATIQYCHANVRGAGVYTSAATLNMNDDATIQYCQAVNNGYGGGVYATSGALNVTDNARIQYCKARDGGGVCISFGTINMTGGAIDDNEAIPGDILFPGDGLIRSYGGGIGAHPNSPLNILSGSISRNTASIGGGICCYAATMAGGVVYTGCPITIGTVSDGPTISGNTATSGSGGGIFGSPGTNIEMFNGVISGNTAGGTGTGGAICVFGDLVNVDYYTASFTMRNGTIGGVNASDGNSATNGGGIYGPGYLTSILITGGNILNNTATNAGGGIYGTDVTISGNTVISDNSAVNYGGGIHISSAHNGATISDAIITDNTATYGGAIFALKGNNVDISGNTLFSNNTATADGGAIYMLDHNDLDLTAGTNVVFSGNTAVASYDLDAEDPLWVYDPTITTLTGFPMFVSDLITLHGAMVATTTYSLPYSYIYNNYDVNFRGDDCKELIAAPSATTPQTFCNGAIVSNLQADGPGIVWYNMPTGGTAFTGTETLVNGKIYYAAQTVDGGCTGERTAVTVIIDNNVVIDAPNVPYEVELCDGTPTPTLADVPTDGNTNIVWFDAPIGGNKVPSTTELNNGDVYYAAIEFGNGACFSIRRAEVNIHLGTTFTDTLKVVSSQDFCEGALVGNLETPNNQFIWYLNETDVIPLDPGEKLIAGTYWAAQKAGTCESNDRQPVVVTLNGYPEPIAPQKQTICNGTIAYISDLMITGAHIKWYNAPSGGTEYTSPETTLLVAGAIYWAAQTAGICESVRIGILITADCVSPKGTVFPFVHTDDDMFNSGFVILAKLYVKPPAGTPNKIGYVRKQAAIKTVLVKYYDCTPGGDDVIVGAPKHPGTMGIFNNPGLPIRWFDALGVTPGDPNSATLTPADRCTTVPIGWYVFDDVASDDYILELSRQGFLSRYGEINTGDLYLGHREMLGGDVDGDMKIDEKDYSAIRAKESVYGNTNYDVRYDLTGDKGVNSLDFNIIRVNFGANNAIYQETEDWVK